MQQLRIAFLDSWLQTVVDGSGTAAAIGGLARTLQARGHLVDRIVPVGNWPRNLTMRRLYYNWQLPRRLANHSYDLVVGFDIDGVRVAQRLNVPYTCSIKGVIAEEQRHEQGFIRGLLWSLSRIEMLNARRAPKVISTSEYCRQMIHAHYGVPTSKVGIVPEGIDLSLWQEQAQSNQRDPWTVLCVARQYPRKHVIDLIRAFASVVEHVPQAQLVIIGDGPDHDLLRGVVRAYNLETSVRMLGALADDAEVRAWYGRSSIFCLPSVQEGFGIVFLEAMASGLPIVSTNAAAIPEVVPHGQAGTLVGPSDVAAIAKAIIELLQNPELQQRYRDYGLQHVQQYSWEHVTDRFLAEVLA
ncbi:glycosyltransferase family 4 protein [Herpetosiphon sp. NSE202]|uniref:glycosyltransferase family 4 protein n=1 Tax=Herpetosiphon sp. NSE202 TaxID=3351349 RepID=UPI0036417739